MSLRRADIHHRMAETVNDVEVKSWHITKGYKLTKHLGAIPIMTKHKKTPIGWRLIHLPTGYAICSARTRVLADIAARQIEGITQIDLSACKQGDVMPKSHLSRRCVKKQIQSIREGAEG